MRLAVELHKAFYGKDKIKHIARKKERLASISTGAPKGSSAIPTAERQ